jgi:hypothetical protein
MLGTFTSESRRIAIRSLFAGAVSGMALFAQSVPAQTPAVTPTATPAVSAAPIVAFEPLNPGGKSDHLADARQIGAAYVAQFLSAPRQITDVGSFTGEFLEAFMVRFPGAKGQWTEPVENNRGNAVRRLGKFGERATYVIGCAARDIALGCVPAGTDVLLTSWLSIHQDRTGITRFYATAARLLPSGGVVVNLDHVAPDRPATAARFKGTRELGQVDGLVARQEGPPIHHPEWTLPTFGEHRAALQAAGFTDIEVIYRRLDTVLIVARKP